VHIVGFCGPSGVGKTTLMEGVIAGLKAAGQQVAVLKHAHKGFDIDQLGKDSWRHRAAGASEVLLASGQRMALLREFDKGGPPDLPELLAQLSAGIDWVLVEGFKHAALPKIEVWRAALGQAPCYPDDAHVLAVATDTPAHLPVPTALPVWQLDQPDALVEHLLAHAARHLYNPADHG